MHISRIIAHVSLATAIAALTASPTDAAWKWTSESTNEAEHEQRNLGAGSGLRGPVEQAVPNEENQQYDQVNESAVGGDHDQNEDQHKQHEDESDNVSPVSNSPISTLPGPIAPNGLPSYRFPTPPAIKPIFQTPFQSVLPSNGFPPPPAIVPISQQPLQSGLPPNGSPMPPANGPNTQQPLLDGSLSITVGGEHDQNEDENQQQDDESNNGIPVVQLPISTPTVPISPSGVPSFEIPTPPANDPVIQQPLQGGLPPYGSPMPPGNGPNTQQPLLDGSLSITVGGEHDQNVDENQQQDDESNNGIPVAQLPISTPTVPISPSGVPSFEIPTPPANDPVIQQPLQGGLPPYGSPTPPANGPNTQQPLLDGSISITVGGEHDQNEDENQQQDDESNNGIPVAQLPISTPTVPISPSGVPSFEIPTPPANDPVIQQPLQGGLPPYGSPTPPANGPNTRQPLLDGSLSVTVGGEHDQNEDENQQQDDESNNGIPVAQLPISTPTVPISPSGVPSFEIPTPPANDPVIQQPLQGGLPPYGSPTPPANGPNTRQPLLDGSLSVTVGGEHDQNEDENQQQDDESNNGIPVAQLPISTPTVPISPSGVPSFEIPTPPANDPVIQQPLQGGLPPYGSPTPPANGPNTQQPLLDGSLSITVGGEHDQNEDENQQQDDKSNNGIPVAQLPISTPTVPISPSGVPSFEIPTPPANDPVIQQPLQGGLPPYGSPTPPANGPNTRQPLLDGSLSVTVGGEHDQNEDENQQQDDESNNGIPVAQLPITTPTVPISPSGVPSFEIPTPPANDPVIQQPLQGGLPPYGSPTPPANGPNTQQPLLDGSLSITVGGEHDQNEDENQQQDDKSNNGIPVAQLPISTPTVPISPSGVPSFEIPTPPANDPVIQQPLQGGLPPYGSPTPPANGPNTQQPLLDGSLSITVGGEHDQNEDENQQQDDESNNGIPVAQLPISTPTVPISPSGVPSFEIPTPPANDPVIQQPLQGGLPPYGSPTPPANGPNTQQPLLDGSLSITVGGEHDQNEDENQQQDDKSNNGIPVAQLPISTPTVPISPSGVPSFEIPTPPANDPVIQQPLQGGLPPYGSPTPPANGPNTQQPLLDGSLSVTVGGEHDQNEDENQQQDGESNNGIPVAQLPISTPTVPISPSGVPSFEIPTPPANDPVIQQPLQGGLPPYGSPTPPANGPNTRQPLLDGSLSVTVGGEHDQNEDENQQQDDESNNGIPVVQLPISTPTVPISPSGVPSFEIPTPPANDPVIQQPLQGGLPPYGSPTPPANGPNTQQPLLDGSLSVTVGGEHDQNEDENQQQDDESNNGIPVAQLPISTPTVPISPSGVPSFEIPTPPANDPVIQQPLQGGLPPYGSPTPPANGPNTQQPLLDGSLSITVGGEHDQNEDENQQQDDESNNGIPVAQLPISTPTVPISPSGVPSFELPTPPANDPVIQQPLQGGLPPYGSPTPPANGPNTQQPLLDGSLSVTVGGEHDQNEDENQQQDGESNNGIPVAQLPISTPTVPISPSGVPSFEIPTPPANDPVIQQPLQGGLPPYGSPTPPANGPNTRQPLLDGSLSVTVGGEHDQNEDENQQQDDESNNGIPVVQLPISTPTVPISPSGVPSFEIPTPPANDPVIQQPLQGGLPPYGSPTPPANGPNTQQPLLDGSLSVTVGGEHDQNEDENQQQDDESNNGIPVAQLPISTPTVPISPSGVPSFEIPTPPANDPVIQQPLQGGLPPYGSPTPPANGPNTQQPLLDGSLSITVGGEHDQNEDENQQQDDESNNGIPVAQLPISTPTVPISPSGVPSFELPTPPANDPVIQQPLQGGLPPYGSPTPPANGPNTQQPLLDGSLSVTVGGEHDQNEDENQQQDDESNNGIPVAQLPISTPTVPISPSGVPSFEIPTPPANDPVIQQPLQGGLPPYGSPTPPANGPNTRQPLLDGSISITVGGEHDQNVDDNQQKDDESNNGIPVAQLPISTPTVPISPSGVPSFEIPTPPANDPVIQQYLQSGSSSSTVNGEMSTTEGTPFATPGTPRVHSSDCPI